MSALLERALPRNGRKAAAGSPLGVGLPQVNLLPPEVTASRRIKEVKGWLGLAVIAAVILVILGYGVSVLDAGRADGEQTHEQQRTSKLLAEKAKYVAVTPVLADLGLATQSVVAAGASEVLWQPYLGAIAAVLPKDATITTLAVATNDASKTGSGDPLVTQGIATITLVGTTTTLPDTAAWITSLDGVPGFADADVSVAKRNGDGDAAYYDVQATVQVTPGAYSHRFDQEGKK
jgi:Tfp pilus assembly protein PilN